MKGCILDLISNPGFEGTE